MGPRGSHAEKLPAEGPARVGALHRVHGVANNPAVRRAVFVLRYPLGVLAVFLVALWSKPEWFFIGMAVSLFGQVIQVWSFASLSKQKVLAARGPYALVRNPMYLGRYFLMLGGVLLTDSALLAVVFTVVYYFYVVNRVAREEAVLAGIFGEAYAEYCARVNRFLPTLRRAEYGAVWFFNWPLFFTNHAHWHVLGTPAVYALLYCFTFLLKIGTEPHFHIEWL